MLQKMISAPSGFPPAQWNELVKTVIQLGKITGDGGISVDFTHGVPCVSLRKPIPAPLELAILGEQLSQNGSAGATIRRWNGSTYDDLEGVIVNDYLLDDDADPLEAGTRVIIQRFPDGRYYVISAACSVRSGEEPA